MQGHLARDFVSERDLENADILCVPARGIAASVRLLRRQRLRNISSFSKRSSGTKDPSKAAAPMVCRCPINARWAPAGSQTASARALLRQVCTGGTCRGLDCQRGEELLKLCIMQRQAPNTCRSRQKNRAANEPHGYNTPDMMCSFGCGRGTGPAWLSADLTYRLKDASQ